MKIRKKNPARIFRGGAGLRFRAYGRQATTNGTLADVSVEFSTDSACCVVLASEGYPQKYESGFPITMSEEMKITIGKNMENWLFIKKNRSASDFVLLLNTAPAPPVRMGRSDSSRRNAINHSRFNL